MAVSHLAFLLLTACLGISFVSEGARSCSWNRRRKTGCWPSIPIPKAPSIPPPKSRRRQPKRVCANSRFNTRCWWVVPKLPSTLPPKAPIPRPKPKTKPTIVPAPKPKPNATPVTGPGVEEWPTNPPKKIPRGFSKGVQKRPRTAKKAPNSYPAWINQYKFKPGWLYTTWICATIKGSATWPRTRSFRGTGTNKKMREFARALGKQTDVAGHIIASMLGFTGREKWNIMPLNSKTNNGPMKSTEYQIRDLARTHGVVKVYMNMTYGGRNPRRPTMIQVLAVFNRTAELYWELVNP